MSAVRMICDFCGACEPKMLISTPEPPFGVRAHICPECVTECARLLVDQLDQQAEAETVEEQPR